MAVRGSLPLAFVLALAATKAATTVPVVGDQEPLAAGHLQSLLSSERSISDSELSDVGVPVTQAGKLAQWFNWFNCFNGVWRRC
jgi:hypothetical protein